MKTAFHTDWQAPPIKIVTSIASAGERVTTMINEGNRMVWHHWNGPLNRPPLILLHGGWGSWTHWIKSIPYLATRTRIFAADIPGMGDSADVDRHANIESLARHVANGLKELLSDGERYDIAGFSFGGVVAAHVASLHKERCNSFTAVGAAGFGSLHKVIGGIQLPAPDLTDDEINVIHANNLNRLMLAHERSIDRLAVYIHRTNIERGRFRSRRISMSKALIEILPSIRAKIGGIWGALDSTGNGIANIKKRRDIFREYRPDCPFDIIEGCGHWVMYERPKAFVNTFNHHLCQYND